MSKRTTLVEDAKKVCLTAAGVMLGLTGFVCLCYAAFKLGRMTGGM